MSEPSVPPVSPEEATDDEEGRIGIFPSWRALYITVVAYTAALIVLLYIFTVMLDFSAQ